MACKLIEGSETDTSHQKLVDLKNIGSLWKVKSDTVIIFTFTESYFVAATKESVTSINAKHLVSLLMKDWRVLAYFESIRRSCDLDVKKEIALNLLEDMLTLYIRVRAHSYAQDKQQLHKMTKGNTKSRSLRTEIKKKTTSLDTGH